MGRMQACEIVELKFISRLGDCSSGPQQLIYISGDVQRCQRWLGQRLFHVALHGGVLIELGHSLSSGGYVHDVVPSG